MDIKICNCLQPVLYMCDVTGICFFFLIDKKKFSGMFSHHSEVQYNHTPQSLFDEIISNKCLGPGRNLTLDFFKNYEKAHNLI